MTPAEAAWVRDRVWTWACPCLTAHVPRVVQDDLLSLLDAS